MKKNSFLKLLSLSAIIFSTLLFLLVAGCQKNPPAPTPTAPILSVTFPQNTIPYGDSASFSWEAKGSVTEVTLNGKRVGFSDTYQTSRLFDSVNSYKLIASGPGGSASKTIAIKVGDWTTSVYGKISHGYWIFGSLSEKSDLTHNVWVVFSKENTDPAYYKEADYYYPDGLFETRDRKTNALIYSLRWNLSGDTISFIGGGHGIVTQATEDTMTTVVRSSFADSTGEKHQAQIRWIYIRDTK